MGFFLKKLVSACLLPFPCGLALLVAALVLLWFTQRQRLGRILASAGVLILLLNGYGVASVVLLRPLEHDYAPLAAGDVSKLQPRPAAIVVLGAGFVDNYHIPANDRMNATGLARLVEGVRLWRLLPDTKLVLSGGMGLAESFAEIAEFLGVPRDHLALENGSADTADEAALTRAVVGEQPFLLVTSAAHMRRSMRLFQKQGLRPIAAPCDFIARGRFAALNLVPEARGLDETDHALHEWFGLMWSRLRGDI